MKKRTMQSALFCAVLSFLAVASNAEDIDLFLSNPNVSASQSKILLSIDNAAASSASIGLFDGTKGDVFEMIRQVLNVAIDPAGSAQDTYFSVMSVADLSTIYCDKNIFGNDITKCTAPGGTPLVAITAGNKSTYIAEIRTVLGALIAKTKLGVELYNPTGTAKGDYIRYHLRDMSVAGNPAALLLKINNPVTTYTGSCTTGNGTCAVNYTGSGSCTDTAATTTTYSGRFTGNCTNTYGAGAVCANLPAGCSGNACTSYTVTTPATYTACTGTPTTIDSGIPKSSSAYYDLSMLEANRYYTGQAPYAGTASNEYDQAAVTAGLYNAPGGANDCGNKYIIFVGTGTPDNGENSLPIIESDLAALLGKTSVGTSDIITLPTSGNQYQSKWFDEYAKAMKKKNGITTFTVAAMDPLGNNFNTPNAVSARTLLQSAASVSGGQYYLGGNAVQFLLAIVDAATQATSVNTSFAAVSLPISVNAKGTFENQVYMGVFRPDADSKPRWFGNLKQYAIGLDANDNPILVDKNNAAIENPQTSFIKDATVSFWTSNSTFWSFDPVTYPSASDSPDGPVVEKGGAAYKLRNAFSATVSGLANASRSVYTCIGCTGSLTTFDKNIAASQFNVATDAIRDSLVNWVRGEDNQTPDEKGNSTTPSLTARPSIHGDVIHSRPVVLNYNRTSVADSTLGCVSGPPCIQSTEEDILVVYGANDGMIHAVKGGQSDADGYEKWAFIPQEFLPRLNRLRDNSPAIASGANSKPYFVDGAISAYQFDAAPADGQYGGTGDKVYIFATMRRGGRFIYALNVSNPNAAPTFMWRKGCSGSPVVCDAGFEELGYTWSKAGVTNIANADGSKRPVLVFGAGYDPTVEDLDPTTVTASTSTTVTTGTGASVVTKTRSMGRAIYVVDIATGALIWKVQSENSTSSCPTGATCITKTGMDYSIPADVAVMTRLQTDSSNDQIADRFYVGDTKGQVWRVSLVDPKTPSGWTVDMLGQVGGSSAVRRKFLGQPEVVFMTGYDAVIVGSGDREHPFDGMAPNTPSIANRFYIFKDTSTGRSVTGTPTAIVESEMDNILDPNDSPPIPNRGCYLPLNGDILDDAAGNGNGEMVTSSPLAAGGKVFFNTHYWPSAVATNICASSLGLARQYEVDLECSVKNTTVNGDIGFLADPVYVITTVNKINSSGEVVGKKTVEVVITTPKVDTVPGVTLGNRNKVYWKRDKESSKK